MIDVEEDDLKALLDDHHVHLVIDVVEAALLPGQPSSSSAPSSSSQTAFGTVVATSLLPNLLASPDSTATTASVVSTSYTPLPLNGLLAAPTPTRPPPRPPA